MRLWMIWLLYRKEFLDLFRDRRTLFTMMILPMLSMPISIGGTHIVMNKSRAEAKQQRFRVAVSAPPDIVAAFRNSGFEISEASDPATRVTSNQADAGITVDPADPKQVRIFTDDSRGLQSVVLKGRLREPFERMHLAQLRAELGKAGLSPALANPPKVQNVNVAAPRKMAGGILGGVIAFMMVIFLLNGAMYGAVDMTAGEKERRTMEVLLSSGAHRTEIVIGKVLMAATMAYITATLSLLSLSISFRLLGDAKDPNGPLNFSMDAMSAGLLLLTFLPFGIMVAAFGVALATPARSAREGMSYLTPIFFISMALGGLSFVPAFENKPWLAVVPISNFLQTFKRLLQGEWTWDLFLVQLAVNILLAAVAVTIAVRKFQDEKILLRV